MPAQFESALSEEETRTLQDALKVLELSTAESAVRMEFLKLSLQALADYDRSRWLYGGVTLGVGVALGGSLYWVKEPSLKGMLGLSAGLLAARGTARLSIALHAGENVKKLLELPMNDTKQVNARLAFGERALRQAARAARRSRIVEGTLTVFAAVAQVPLSWGLARIEDRDYRFGDSAVDLVGLSLSVIGCASGLVQALRKSDVERLEQQYNALPR